MGIGLLEDERVTALGLHIEGVDDIRALEALSAKARELGKPIVALKVGKSEQARAATVSHTASLAGSDAGSSALFDRLGIAQVSDLPALLETLKVLHVAGPLTSNRVASMSCSGGEASLMADVSLGYDLQFPPLDAVQQSGLRNALGPMVALANPLDYHTYIWRNREKIGETFAAMMTGDLGMGMVVLDFPRADRCNPVEWDDVTHGTAFAASASGKPMAIISSLQECMPESEALKMIEMGIVPLSGMREGLEAVAAAAWLGQQAEQMQPVLLPGADRAADIVPENLAKEELSTFGLAVPNRKAASDPISAGRVAEGLGFPVVLKGEGFAHKTEAGAVRIGLQSAGEVEEAARAMKAQGFLVEEMVKGAVAEILIGVVRDPAHGFVLTLGAGGQLTELLQDSQSLLLPASGQQIRDAVAKLRIAKVLNGYRGQAGADMDGIIAAVSAVQDYVIANAGTVEEVEINPLIVTSERAIAVDALIRKAT